LFPDSLWKMQFRLLESCYTCSVGAIRVQMELKCHQHSHYPIMLSTGVGVLSSQDSFNHLFCISCSLPSSPLSTSVALWGDHGLWSWMAMVAFWLSWKLCEKVCMTHAVSSVRLNFLSISYRPQGGWFLRNQINICWLNVKSSCI
jgi:hypothetical protein